MINVICVISRAKVGLLGGCGRWHAGASAAAGEVGRGPPVRPHPSRGGRPLAEIPSFPRREGVFRDSLPFSRRGKPISSKFYRLPAARNRFSGDFIAFPPRETVFLRIFPISRRGKAFFERFSPFPAAGRRFSKVLIGFPRREGVFEGQRSVSRLIFAFQKSRDRFRVSFSRFRNSTIGLVSYNAIS